MYHIPFKELTNCIHPMPWYEQATNVLMVVGNAAAYSAWLCLNARHAFGSAFQKLSSDKEMPLYGDESMRL
jgi:hypothetical protein